MLLKIKWWDQPLTWLKQHWELMCDIEALIRYYNENTGEFIHTTELHNYDEIEDALI